MALPGTSAGGCGSQMAGSAQRSHDAPRTRARGHYLHDCSSRCSSGVVRSDWPDFLCEALYSSLSCSGRNPCSVVLVCWGVLCHPRLRAAQVWAWFREGRLLWGEDELCFLLLWAWGGEGGGGAVCLSVNKDKDSVCLTVPNLK